MGVSKTSLFSQEQNELADFARAFSHPARIAIIEHLLEANQCINGDLVKELGLAQATISQHLKGLKEMGIIKGEVEGTSMCYCIDATTWARVENRFKSMFRQFDSTCC